MSETGNPPKKNPWYKRYAKFELALLAGVVETVNASTGGPHWVYVAAGFGGAILLAIKGNAPKYSNGQN